MKQEERPSPGFGRAVPPRWLHVQIYFEQKGLSEQVAEEFFQIQKDKKWRFDNHKRVSNWKKLANDWIWDYLQANKANASSLKLF